MTEPYQIKLPLVNPNEPEAILAALFIQENQWVEQNALLCVLETTKSTFELTAEISGYVAGLRLLQGDRVRAGDVLCALVQTQDDIARYTAEETLSIHETHGEPTGQASTGLRLTQPAKKLAEEHSLELASLPHDRLLTRDDIQRIIEQQGKHPSGDANLGVVEHQDKPHTKSKFDSEGVFDPQAILLYGGGGHAKMLIDLIREARVYHIAGILDDQMERGTEIMGAPVLGGEAELSRLYQQGIRLAVNAVGGIGNILSRIHVFQKLTKAGFAFPPVIHPSAVVERSAVVSPGAQVFARAYVGGDVQVGFGAIASTGCILSHDCVLEEYAIVSPGAILAGEVRIGSGALVGMGVTINLRVVIGTRARIGNNATINSDVPPKSIVQAGSVFR